jgi:hypothetical protein
MNLEWREPLEQGIALLRGLVGNEWCSDVFRAAARAELDDLQEQYDARIALMSEECRKEEFGSGTD